MWWLSACVHALLYLLRIYGCAARAAAMHGEGRGREGGRWDLLSWRRAICHSRRGASGRWCAAAVMVVGSAHASLSGIGQQRTKSSKPFYFLLMCLEFDHLNHANVPLKHNQQTHYICHVIACFYAMSRLLFT